MDRYFFDISDGVDIHDDIGQLLPSIEEARLHAITRAAVFVAQLNGGGLGGHVVVTVRDARAALCILRLVCQIETLEKAREAAAPPAATQSPAAA